MKKITRKWLKDVGACQDCIEWIETLDTDNPIDIIRIAIKSKDKQLLGHCNWITTRLLSRKDRIRYAAYAADLVLPIWEAKYPNDSRPRKAIEAAKKVAKMDNESNRELADAAFAADAAYAAHATYAARTAYAAACAADYAAKWSVTADDDAAAYVVPIAARASGDYTGTMIKCLKYGIKLLQGDVN